MILGIPERRRCHRLADGARVFAFASGKRSSRASQSALKIRYERVRAAEHAPRGPLRLLERLHCLVDIIKRGVVVSAERQRVKPPHPEREIIILSKNVLRHGYRFVHQ